MYEKWISYKTIFSLFWRYIGAKLNIVVIFKACCKVGADVGACIIPIVLSIARSSSPVYSILVTHPSIFLNFFPYLFPRITTMSTGGKWNSKENIEDTLGKKKQYILAAMFTWEKSLLFWFKTKKEVAHNCTAIGVKKETLTTYSSLTIRNVTKHSSGWELTVSYLEDSVNYGQQ